MNDILEYDSKILLDTWSMEMCYEVEYINTTIVRTKPMIEL
jgi:hypothetical protein